MQIKNNKYLSLRIDEEIYAIHLLIVKEIISEAKIVRVPRVDKYIKGFIDLRGSIIPIIDLRLRLNIAEREIDGQTSIIIVETGSNTKAGEAGLIVDKVTDILQLESSDIKEVTGKENFFFTGISEFGGKKITLLDIDKITAVD